MKISALRAVPLFRALDDEAANELCELLTMRDVPAGTSLFHRGEPGDAMYLIENGRVRISLKDTDGHDATLAEMDDGDFFGEMSLLDGHARSADATTSVDCRLAVLSRADFRSFLRKDPDIALGILTALTHRLRRTDDLLRHRVSRNANEEEAARLTVADRAADMIAEFGGSWKFIGASIAFSLLWILFNTWFLFHPFDHIPIRFAQSRPRHGGRLAGAHHHDVAKSPGPKGPAPGRSRLPGEPEKRTPAFRSAAPPRSDRDAQHRSAEDEFEFGPED